MRKSHTLRCLVVAILATTCGLSSAASYKCRDAKGNWSEAACTGPAAPPPKPKSIDWAQWKPVVGMKMAEVTAALAAFDQERNKFTEADRMRGAGPSNEWLAWTPKINRTTTAAGDQEQWVFGAGFGTPKYLYFDDGILTAIQD